MGGGLEVALSLDYRVVSNNPKTELGLPETKVGNTTVVAERIRERLAASRFEVGSDSVVVTASIGIAGVDSLDSDAALSPAILIDRADQALYSAKHHGRNRVEMWDIGMQGAELLH